RPPPGPARAPHGRPARGRSRVRGRSKGRAPPAVSQTQWFRRHRRRSSSAAARGGAAGCTVAAMNVLAIDQGTSSTKALLVADGGEIVGESSAPVNPRSGAEGAVEQDPEELFQSIVTAGLQALRK